MAFDTINHGVLLKCLVETACTGFALSSSIRPRKWCRETIAPPLGLLGSLRVNFVPQLFDMYMKLLGDGIRTKGLGCHQYSDEMPSSTLIYHLIPRGQWVLCTGTCRRVVGCMKANTPKLNPNRTEILLVGASLVLGHCCVVMLAGIAIIPKSSICSLGCCCLVFSWQPWL